MDGRDMAWHPEPMEAHEAAAREAAERAGEILRERLRLPHRTELKSSAIDLVTEADRASERAVLEVLRKHFPGYAVLAEESGARGDGLPRWIVDPLDGTTNFAHSYPQVSVSIALEDEAGIRLGLIYDPLRQETFLAHRGGGATLNGQPIRVSATEGLASSLLATGFPYDRRDQADFYLAFFKAFMMRTQGIRRAGSAALDLCWVACGRVDGFWEWKLRAWDTAAGALVVREAGGETTDFDGRPFDPHGMQTLASNGLLHRSMLDAIGGVLRSLRSAER